MGRGRIRARLGAALLLACSIATAEVTEEHAEQPYTVDIQPGQTLRQALNAATPIREGGQRFHGHTQWNVHWSFWWNRDAAGHCRIARVSTRLSTHIQMPVLRTATDAQQARFARYARALHQHEQGHVQFGRRAAQSIDQGIAALSEAPDCSTLERQANALGHRLLAEQATLEKTYDRDTRHGATQGAQVD